MLNMNNSMGESLGSLNGESVKWQLYIVVLIGVSYSAIYPSLIIIYLFISLNFQLAQNKSSFLHESANKIQLEQ